MSIDPVCRMEVEPKKARTKSEYRNKTYYFCGPGCKAQFESDPERYIRDREGTRPDHGHYQ